MISTAVDLRRAAVAATLFPPASIAEAVNRLGFVQADPIRAPARAQDLILRHRTAGYRAGDLERSYPSLDIEEGFSINYGFLPRDTYALMHPRSKLGRWPTPGRRAAEAVLAFVSARGRAHPREVDGHFAHGSVTNYWGGTSSATTHVLDHLHYRGLLRVAAREAGVRIYAPQGSWAPALDARERRGRLDALVDVFVGVYAPLPSPTLSWLLNRLRIAVPQWEADVRSALERARRRLVRAHVDGIDWYWREEAGLEAREPDDVVRLLAPFDPIVWDRRRFARLWGWAYRFEAYTPPARRRYGYYALPMVWRDRVIGWANVSRRAETLHVEFGYAAGRAPRDAAFRRAREREVALLRTFLRPPRAAGRRASAPEGRSADRAQESNRRGAQEG